MVWALTVWNLRGNETPLFLSCSSSHRHHLCWICTGSGAVGLVLFPAYLCGNRPCVLCCQLHQSGQLIIHLSVRFWYCCFFLVGGTITFFKKNLPKSYIHEQVLWTSNTVYPIEVYVLHNRFVFSLEVNGFQFCSGESCGIPASSDQDALCCSGTFPWALFLWFGLFAF